MAHSANGLGAPPQAVMRGFVREDPLSQPAPAEFASLGGQPAVARRSGGSSRQVERQSSAGSSSVVPDAELLVLLGQGQRAQQRSRIPGMPDTGTGSGSATSGASDHLNRRHTYDRGPESEPSLSDPFHSLSDDMTAARGMNSTMDARGTGRRRLGEGNWPRHHAPRSVLPPGAGGHSPSGFLTSDSDDKRAAARRGMLSSSDEPKRPVRGGMLQSGAESSGPHFGTMASVAQSVDSASASRMPRPASLARPSVSRSHQVSAQDLSFGLSPATLSSEGSRPQTGDGSTAGGSGFHGRHPSLNGLVGARPPHSTAAGMGIGSAHLFAVPAPMPAQLMHAPSQFAGDAAIRFSGDSSAPPASSWQNTVGTSAGLRAESGAESFQAPPPSRGSASTDPMAALNTPRWARGPMPSPDAYRGLYAPAPAASASTPMTHRMAGAQSGWGSLPPSWYPSPGTAPHHGAPGHAAVAASASASDAMQVSPLSSTGGADPRGLSSAQYGGMVSAGAPYPPGMMPRPSNGPPSFAGHPMVAPRQLPSPPDYQFVHYPPVCGARYVPQDLPPQSQPAWSHMPPGQLRTYQPMDEGQSPMWQRAAVGGVTPGAPTPGARGGGGGGLVGSSMLSPHSWQQHGYAMGSLPVIPPGGTSQPQAGGMDTPAHAMGFTPMGATSVWRHPLAPPGMGYSQGAMSQGSFASSPAASADLARLSTSMGFTTSVPSSLAIPAVSAGGAPTATLSDGSTLGSLLPFDATPHRLGARPRGLGAVAAAAVAAGACGVPNPVVAMAAPMPGQVVLDSPFAGMSMLGDPTPRAPGVAFQGPPQLSTQPPSTGGLGLGVFAADTSQAAGPAAVPAAIFPSGSPASSSGSHAGPLSSRPMEQLASIALQAPPGTLAGQLVQSEPLAKRSRPDDASVARDAWQNRPDGEPDFTRPLDRRDPAAAAAAGPPAPATPASPQSVTATRTAQGANPAPAAAKSTRAPKRKRGSAKDSSKWKCPHCDNTTFASFALLSSHLRNDQ